MFHNQITNRCWALWSYCGSELQAFGIRDLLSRVWFSAWMFQTSWMLTRAWTRLIRSDRQKIHPDRKSYPAYEDGLGLHASKMSGLCMCAYWIYSLIILLVCSWANERAFTVWQHVKASATVLHVSLMSAILAQEYSKHIEPGSKTFASKAACEFMYVRLLEVMPYTFPFLSFPFFSPCLTALYHRHLPPLQADKAYTLAVLVQNLAFPHSCFVGSLKHPASICDCRALTETWGSSGVSTSHSTALSSSPLPAVREESSVHNRAALT